MKIISPDFKGKSNFIGFEPGISALFESIILTIEALYFENTSLLDIMSRYL